MPELHITEVSFDGARMRVEGNEGVKKVALLLPGISGQVMSERFDPLARALRGVGFRLARLEIWTDAQDAGTRTLKDIHAAVRLALDELTEEGCTRIVAIGKSFGGGVLLSLQDPRIERKILWAPAIGCAKEGNLEMMASATLSHVEKLLDIKVACDAIRNDPASIVIIHGTEDSVIPIENSEDIMALRGGKVIVIEGADHSFKVAAHEEKLLKATIGAL